MPRLELVVVIGLVAPALLNIEGFHCDMLLLFFLCVSSCLNLPREKLCMILCLTSGCARWIYDFTDSAT